MSPPARSTSPPEVIFLVEEAPEGGFTARARGESIFTEGNTLADLHAKVRDAVHGHFDEGKVPNRAPIRARSPPARRGDRW